MCFAFKNCCLNSQRSCGYSLSRGFQEELSFLEKGLLAVQGRLPYLL